MIRYINGYILYPVLELASGRSIRQKLNELKKFNDLTLLEQDQLRKKEMFKFLQFCRNNVPYYKDIFQKYSFDEERVLIDLKYVEDLPLLTKSVVKSNVDRLRVTGARHERKTGGSTGQSVFFYYDDVGLDWTSAINSYAYLMAGNLPHMMDCHISSELGIAWTSKRDKYLDTLKLFSQNRTRLMIRSFSDVDLKNTYENLSRRKPYLLQGHPSSAYAIASYIKENRLKRTRYCSVFEPSGEMLTPKMVEVIQEFLGCKVVNRYGNAEFGVMAHSRLHDSYRKLQIFNRAFYFEEVDSGELVVTNFTNYSFPLIRYATGDIGTVINEGDGSFLYDIEGRIHDVVEINGEPYATHFIMDYLDHKIRGIREFQIVLKVSEDPILNVVLENEYDRARVCKEILERWPEGLSIDFVRHDQLIRSGWQQKFRHLVDLRGIPNE